MSEPADRFRLLARAQASIRRRFGRTGLLAALVMLAACAQNAPQDALSPEGPIARRQDALFRPVFWIAVVIFFLVEGLVIFAAIRFRDRGGRDEPKQIHGNTVLEFGWTLIPAIIMLGVAIPTVITIFDLNPVAAADEVRVKVIGHQWWWEYRYDTDPEVVTANELVIPAGRPVFLELESAPGDVIHSFWVPKLAGKQDVVPGRTNTLTIAADEPGTYLGQCAEFCAVSHANMRLRVVSKTEADYAAWVSDQQRVAIDPAAGEAARGQSVFLANACVNCHAIRGTGAGGQTAPDLTHFASRGTFAGSMLERNEQNLAEWIRGARDVKPGVVMPNFPQLSDADVRALVAYLMTLG